MEKEWIKEDLKTAWNNGRDLMRYEKRLAKALSRAYERGKKEERYRICAVQAGQDQNDTMTKLKRNKG